MGLAQRLKPSHKLFALDDGVMLSASQFLFQSIEDVARNCLPHVKSICASYGEVSSDGSYTISLAGWSYGGVVATEVAKMLQQENLDSAGSIHVEKLTLLDAPLRRPVTTDISSEVHAHDSVEGEHGSDAQLEHDDIAARTQQHFSNCTALLTIYQARPVETSKLICTVDDIRPANGEFQFDESAVREVTAGPINSMTVPGTHWSMLTGVALENISDQLIRIPSSSSS
jgi:thioesterase domain-containing protein